MPEHICEKCNKIFNKKSAYASHMIRVKSCIKDTNINNECNYCNKTYSTRFNLNAHLKICKEKIITDDNKQIQIDELKKLFEQQQKKIDELTQLTEQKETNTNFTVNDNSINTTNNIINIYSAGKEDLSHLSKEDIIKICTSGTYYPLVAAEIIHCNEKYPKYQNFIISNLRSNDGLVLINDKWISRTQDEILSTLLKVDKNHVSTLIKDLEVEDKLKIKLESTKDEIDTNENKEHQKNRIKRKLYNASKMIIKNKKNAEKILN